MSDANEGWEKVDAAETWNFEENSELTGVYHAKEEQVGPNLSNIYTIQTPDGKYVRVWGNAVLDNRFEQVDLGEEVKIVYYGKVKSEKTGRSYHNYDMWTRKVPFKKVEEKQEESTPKPPTPEEDKGKLTGPEEKVEEDNLPF